MASYITISMLWPVLTLTAIAVFFLYYWRMLLPRRGTLEWSAPQNPSPGPLTFLVRRFPMEKGDRLPLLVLTLAYAATAFFQLGATSAPQTAQTFQPGAPVVVELGSQIILDKFMYYPNLGTGRYNVEISADGTTWLTLWNRVDEGGETTGYYWAEAEGYDPSYVLTQTYAQLFKWIEIIPENPQYARYLRITGAPDKDLLRLGELALYDSGQRTDAGAPSQSPLLDEGGTVPAKPYWTNSTYFDEIYHARTALEHLEGIYPYEVSHPPLGKLILSVGIQIFGMTPFGWRFMGALFGVLMVPLLYILLKNLFGKTPVALCGAALFAFDFMHLTQTRIATIDTYGVFFILAAYFFLYRYLTTPPGGRFRREAVPLLLSGLSFGLGAASKWTVLYAGAGLALLYFVGLFLKLRDWPDGEEYRPMGPWLVTTLGFSVLCFVLIPGGIYLLSYLPYAYAQGDMSLGNLWRVMWDNQVFMFTYHEGVTAEHPYSSRWYQWLGDIRPILYYLETDAQTGLKTAFGCLSHPVVAWGGLLALVSAAVDIFRRRSAKALFIVVGYLSQLVPWIFIGRTTFAYHYFPSTLFLVLALGYVFDQLMERRRTAWKGPIYGLTAGAVGLYMLFYPVLIGLAVPAWYGDVLLKWLPSWPF